MRKNTTVAPMLMQGASALATFPVQSMRLLDGSDPAKDPTKDGNDPAKDPIKDPAKDPAKDPTKDPSKDPQVSDEVAKLLKEQMATKEKLRAAEAAAEETKKKLEAYSGIDPTKAKELLDAAAQAEADKVKAEEERLKAAGDFERLKAMMVESHQKETEALKTQVTETRGALDAAQSVIENLTVGSQFTQSDYIAKTTVLPPARARQLFGTYFDVVDGQAVGFDKPRGEKNRTQLVDGSGNALPFEQAIQKIVEAQPDKNSLLRSTMKDGTGTTTTDVKPGQRVDTTQKPQGPTGLARMKIAIEKGALTKKK